MDKKISQLDPAAALDGTELLAVVQGGSTLKSAVSTVKTYLDAFYQPLDADLTAIAALGYASTSFLKKTGANTWALDTNTYQVSNANLTSLAGLTYVSGSFVKMTGANTFSLDTSTYLTTATAASTYVPLTRELTINGVTYDLSANRSWTVSVAAEDLATTLAAGNTSGAYDILMNTTQRIGFKDGDNTNTSYISNNQTAPSATMYLPHYDGRAVIHATGTSLTSGRVPYVTTNGLIADSANFTWDNSTKILAISNNGASGYTGTTSSSTSLAYAAYYNSDAAYTAISKRSSGVVGNVDATSIALANLGVVQSVSAGGASLAPMFIGGSVIYGVTSNTDVSAIGIRIGTAGVRIDKQNNLTSAASAALHTVGSTADTTAYSFISADSSGYENVRFRNDGFKHFRINQNDLLGIRNENTNAGNSAGALMNFSVASTANMEIGVVNGTAWTAYATGANDSFIANGLSAGALNLVHRNAGRILMWTGNSPGSSNIAAISINSSQNVGFNIDYTGVTARVDIAAATTSYASLRIRAGVAPSLPNDGDMWYVDTNDRLMFYKNGTSNEILAASAVTTESVTSDTTLTITYNGTTYKLLAKA